ncbi:unnamed protein product [Prorocentrum cordatum]|uniref:Uncharacterized protein n=1 Tax=Prorocentrum cordatum TaxID=2364126 RepID=A0ABN9UN84_9DINO|nr:unnamed protein product [Polarella glacialis]
MVLALLAHPRGPNGDTGWPRERGAVGQGSAAARPGQWVSAGVLGLCSGGGLADLQVDVDTSNMSQDDMLESASLQRARLSMGVALEAEWPFRGRRLVGAQPCLNRGHAGHGGLHAGQADDAQQHVLPSRCQIPVTRRGASERHSQVRS